MSNRFKNTLAVLSFLVAPASVSVYANPAPVVRVLGETLVYNLYITFPSHGVANMSWDSMPGSGNYDVLVEDLTSPQTIASFSTSNTWATVNNIPSGHLCRFKVQKVDSYIITEMETP